VGWVEGGGRGWGWYSNACDSTPQNQPIVKSLYLWGGWGWGRVEGGGVTWGTGWNRKGVGALYLSNSISISLMIRNETELPSYILKLMLGELLDDGSAYRPTGRKYCGSHVTRWMNVFLLFSQRSSSQVNFGGASKYISMQGNYYI
jgi:hypothetical protein